MGIWRRAKEKVREKALAAVFRRQLAKLPERERAALEHLIERHPKLFETIAREVQEKVDRGVDQFYALAGVLQKHQRALQEALRELERQ